MKSDVVVTNLGEAALKGMLYLGFVFYVTF